MQTSRERLSLLLAGAMILGAGIARADHVRGIKATITSVNPATGEVQIDVTAYADGPVATNDSTQLGTNYPTNNTNPYYPNPIPAIEWGDGATVATTRIDVVDNGTPAVYRGSFSHTYPDTTTRTIRVGTSCCGGYAGSPGNTTITGNPLYTTVYNSFIVGFTNTVEASFATPTPTPTGAPGDTPTPTPTGGASTPTPTPTTDPATPTPTHTAGATPTPTSTVAPTASPTPTVGATSTPGPTSTPTPTPAPGGSITVTRRVSDSGQPGSVVGSGTFEIPGTAGATTRVSSVTVAVEDPSLVSELGLDCAVDGVVRNVTIAPVSAVNELFFSPPLEIPAGETADCAVAVKLAEGIALGDRRALVLAAVAGGSAETGPGSGPWLPLGAALGMVGLAGSGPRRGWLGLVVLMALVGGSAGCGDDDRPSGAATTQSLTGISASTSEGPLTYSGLPADLGTVRRR